MINLFNTFKLSKQRYIKIKAILLTGMLLRDKIRFHKLNIINIGLV